MQLMLPILMSPLAPPPHPLLLAALAVATGPPIYFPILLLLPPFLLPVALLWLPSHNSHLTMHQYIGCHHHLALATTHNSSPSHNQPSNTCVQAWRVEKPSLDLVLFWSFWSYFSYDHDHSSLYLPNKSPSQNQPPATHLSCKWLKPNQSWSFVTLFTDWSLRWPPMCITIQFAFLPKNIWYLLLTF